MKEIPAAKCQLSCTTILSSLSNVMGISFAPFWFGNAQKTQVKGLFSIFM
jgi:hypothetical protein